MSRFAELQRYRVTEVQRCRDADVQRHTCQDVQPDEVHRCRCACAVCRGAEVQEQRRRDAEEVQRCICLVDLQRYRVTEVQRCRCAEAYRSVCVVVHAQCAEVVVGAEVDIGFFAVAIRSLHPTSAS